MAKFIKIKMDNVIREIEAVNLERFQTKGWKLVKVEKTVIAPIKVKTPQIENVIPAFNEKDELAV